MPKFDNGAVRLHYRISGSQGPPLILIGGMGMPLQGWAYQARDLANDFQLIRLDNRGCGSSSVPEFPYTIRDMAGDVLALMDHLDLPSAHILGTSMGGFIALELALLSPRRVRSLILAHTAPSVPVLTRQRTRLWESLMTEGVPERTMAMEQLVWFFPETSLKEETETERLLCILMLGKEAQTPAGFRGQAQASQGFDVTGRLGDIRMPALLISSEDDITIPLAHTRKLTQLPGLKLFKIFPSAGHLSHLICATEFNRTVLDFLRAYPG